MKRVRAAAMAALLAGCGGEEPPRPADGGIGVEPGAAMDTTPAGTPAPPAPQGLEAAGEPR